MNEKSILGGCVGSLIAIVGAQAADLPVKAKPVEYVRSAACTVWGSITSPAPTCASRSAAMCVRKPSGAPRKGLPFGSSYNGRYCPNTIVNALFNRPSDNIQFTGRADAHRGCAQPVGIRNDPCLYPHRRESSTTLRRRPLSPSGPLFSLPASPLARRSRSSTFQHHGG